MVLRLSLAALVAAAAAYASEAACGDLPVASPTPTPTTIMPAPTTATPTSPTPSAIPEPTTPTATTLTPSVIPEPSTPTPTTPTPSTIPKPTAPTPKPTSATPTMAPIPATTWVEIGRGYKQVAADNAYVCLLDTTKQVVCAASPSSTTKWDKRDGEWSTIAVGGNSVAEYSYANGTAVVSDITTGTSVEISTSFAKHVATNGDIFCAREQTTGAQNHISMKCMPYTDKFGQQQWKYQEAQKHYFAFHASASTVYALDKVNNLHVGATAEIASGEVKWTDVKCPGFSQIAFNGERVCGITADTKQIQCSISSLSERRITWSEPLPGRSWISVALSNNKVYAVDNDGVAQTHSVPSMA
ncbi:hypothetical protein SDRG_11761 [Saprolegnia diclina VS20]|uniref:Ricin B lectin domain-containing protein n=1 Tax=Saprolegnia diclina (strain VS20) TaxID=1156394 RepID=T0RKE3_SAPDV|nr:hypothetical protein SDRG_11761 [Saprolegnia diclina VS20]EQC30442.1 hypothetical protein SDRG_11761 [Saprolegnia diclina VS20]|eukprot:XP_008616035.1 hypothetical protein SDRG_11761 [Saprolegnia diclina VS20]